MRLTQLSLIVSITLIGVALGAAVVDAANPSDLDFETVKDITL